MRFTFSLLNAFSQRNQDNNTAALQDVRELTQDELDQVYGGHGKDCHHNHKNHHHSNNSNKECNNYCDYSYYNCYTY